MTFGPDAERILLSLIEDGVSAGADSLAAVSHTKWTTQTLSIRIDGTESIKNVQDRLDWDKAEHYGAFLSMPGAVFLLVLPKKSGPALAQAFLGERLRRSGRPAPREEVCIAEIANIVINAVVNTLANACDDSFILSAPAMIVGKQSDLLQRALDEVRTDGEAFAIMTYVSMASEALSSDCTAVLLLSPDGRERILSALDPA